MSEASAEHAMFVYLNLAWISHQKKQFPGRDRLLIVAAAEACQHGLLNVAEQCRSIVVANAPHHFLVRHASFADAMRDPDFTPLLKQLRRSCPLEQAEMLLSQQSTGTEENKSATDLLNAMMEVD